MLLTPGGMTLMLLNAPNVAWQENETSGAAQNISKKILSVFKPFLSPTTKRADKHLLVISWDYYYNEHTFFLNAFYSTNDSFNSMKF